MKTKIKPSTQELMNTASTLSQLAAEAAELSRLLLESGGELTPEIEQRLDVNNQLLLKKTDAYNYIIEEFEAHAAMWKRRKDACAAIEKRFTSQVDRLWTRIKEAMKEMGRAEISGSQYRFKLQRSKPKLVIDESQIPEQFKMIIQTTAIDRQKIEEAISEGFSVPGVTVEENGTLRVYENVSEE